MLPQFRAASLPLPPSFPPSKLRPIPSPFLPLQNLNFPSLSIIHIKSQPGNRNLNFRSYAKKGNIKSNGNKVKVKNGRTRFNVRWVDLVLDPDPDNIVAVGLTGLLTWASVRVLWQLFVISAAILFSALKYTVVAVLLIVILITLI